MIKRLLLLISFLNLLFSYEIDKKIEKDERELVRILLEDDTRYFRKLIPIIDSLNYEEFSKLYDGNYKYEGYNSDYTSSFTALAFKFYIFKFILSDWFYKKDYYKYLKKLWIKYPNIDKMSNLNKEDISNKLKSILTDYIDWPENIKNELVELIQKPSILASEIKKYIEENNSEVDIIIKKIIEMKNSKIQSYDEYINENSLYNQLKNLINPKEFRKKEESNQTEFSEQKSFYKDNFNIILFNIVHQTIKRNKFINSTLEIIENKIVEIYNSKNDTKINEDNNLQDIKECINKGKSKWSPMLNLGINALFDLYETYKISEETFNSIQTLKNLMQSKDEYQATLKKISEDFEKAQIPKYLSNDQKNNLKLINESFNKIGKVRKDIIELIEKIKVQIELKKKEKINSYSNFAFKGFNAILSIYDLFKNKDGIIKAFNFINVLISGTHMTFIGLDIFYLDQIIREYQKLLKEAYDLHEKIKNEIDDLLKECNDIKHTFPESNDL